MKSSAVIIVTCAIVLLLVLGIGQRSDRNTLSGIVTHVRDGDTIEVADVPIIPSPAE